MTIVEGQVEPLKKLKESLTRSAITRFDSIGDITRFLRHFESEKAQLASQVQTELETEIHALQSALVSNQQTYDRLRTSIQSEIEDEIQALKIEAARANDKRQRSIIFKVFYFLKIRSLLRKRNKLNDNLESILNTKTAKAANTLDRLRISITYHLDNKETILAERRKKALAALTHTKQVVDELYPLVAGAIGESAVVKTLQTLSDNYYLINDFSLKFDRPIYNKRENDKIFSIQIDHLLVSPAGVFALETKNWSKASVEDLDLRSPVKQVLRTSFALFVLLNSDSRFNSIALERHHWGAKKIPVRNIIVMTNEKPKEEFKHVKVLSLNELIGYIEYFDEVFSDEEVKRIFEYLKERMQAR